MDVNKLLEEIEQKEEQIYETYHYLHSIPEKGWEEKKTSTFLADKLEEAGFEVTRNVGGTYGVIGTLRGEEEGPTYAIRADMDALNFGTCNIHACGHDANSTMALNACLKMAEVGIKRGTLKMVFQPAEEVLGGSLALIESGLLDDIDEMVGIHLRPIQEAKLGEATAMLRHGASGFIHAKVTGQASHGARPHLGINAIDGAAAVVNAINAIKLDPNVPYSVKTTKLVAGGASSNLIPDTAELTFDFRAQTNELLKKLIDKTMNAVEQGAKSVGAKGEAEVAGGVPAADYDPEVTERTEEAIKMVLGDVLESIVTPGGEDFHYYSTKAGIKTSFIGLGANLTPGLHDPEMKFDLKALIYGTQIIACSIFNRLNA